MNDEIKEITDDLIKNRDKLVRGFYFPEDLLGTLDLIKLIDYITNLQQENETKTTKLNAIRKYLLNEIERLRNEIKKISEQHIYTLDKLIETQTRIEKTIEYIKSNYIDNPIEFKEDLLNILNGGDEQ